MKLTEIKLFKNTPITDLVNTIHFQSKSERDEYFLNRNLFETIEFQSRFNFIKDRGTITVPHAYKECQGVNYCTFLSEFENERMYAFVHRIEYLNDNATKLYIQIDGVMNDTQSTVLETLNNVHVIRQHYTKNEYAQNLKRLRTNSDVLKTSTKAYVEQNLYRFTDMVVIFQSSVSLSANFGTRDDPNISTSTGSYRDGVSSPMNLYAVIQDDFEDMMTHLSDYPWIAQNLKKIIMFPLEFVDLNNDTEKVKLGDTSFDGLRKFKSNKFTKDKELNLISYSLDELCTVYGLDKDQDLHLLRSEYTTLELYNWQGQSLNLDNGFIDDETGLKLMAIASSGNVNRIVIFPLNYKTTSFENDITGSKGVYTYKGSFLNDAFIYSNFDEIPILIDNYNLSLAKTANSRNLAESKLLTNRIADFNNEDSTIEDKMFTLLSVSTNLSTSDLLGKLETQYEFYRSQKAEQADLALTSPSITDQTTENGFSFGHNFFGITVKLSKPNEQELFKIKKYYKLFGFEQDEMMDRISSIDSMTYFNWLQIRGNYLFDNVDVQVMAETKLRLENGVRFWRNDWTNNPFKKDIMQNKMFK